MPPPISPAASGLQAAPSKAAQQAGKEIQAKSAAKIRKASKDFEAILAEQMLKSARRTSPGKGLFPKSAGREINEGMADEQLARAMTRGRGLGVGDYLADQLTRPTTKPSSPGALRPIHQGKTVHSAGVGGPR